MTLRLTPRESANQTPQAGSNRTAGKTASTPARATKHSRAEKSETKGATKPTMLAEPPATLPFPSGAVQQMHEAARELRSQRLDRVTHRKSAIEHAERALRQVEVHSQALLNQLATEAQARIGALRQSQSQTQSPPPEPPNAA